ncbi:MAG TPA: carbon-nitrogen hydrolase family protein [Candidatus Tectomicrobia bacterium]
MTLNRRQFLKAGTFGIAAMTSAAAFTAMPMPTLRVALLHLAPRPADLAYNRRLLETAVTTAVGLGAAWILTPELCICGYAFADEIGTDWIVPPPDPWMRDLCQLVARLHVTVFLSHPERDPQTAKLHNSVFVMAANGTILSVRMRIRRGLPEAYRPKGHNFWSRLPPGPRASMGRMATGSADTPAQRRAYHKDLE